MLKEQTKVFIPKDRYAEFAQLLCENTEDYSEILDRFEVTPSTVRNYLQFARGYKVNASMAHTIYKNTSRALREEIIKYLEQHPEIDLTYKAKNKIEPTQNKGYKDRSGYRLKKRLVQFADRESAEAHQSLKSLNKLDEQVDAIAQATNTNSLDAVEVSEAAIKEDEPTLASKKLELLNKIIDVIQKL